MSDANKKNFAAIEQAINTLAKENSKFRERVGILENNLAILHAELANQKQLVAHVMGRGMGSTVHTNGSND